MRVGRGRVRGQRRQHLLQVSRRQRVVGVQRDDEFASSGADPGVASGGETPVGGADHAGTEEIQSFDDGDRLGVVRAVVDHHDLE